MRILFLHRYCIEDALATNASLLSTLNHLTEMGHKVTYLSFKGGRGDIPIRVSFEEINFQLKRGCPRDKILKSILWILAAPLKAMILSWRNSANLIYCDDSIPFYPLLIKFLLMGTRCKIVMRLGDLQTGYLFDKPGFINKLLFKVFHGLEKFQWRTVDGIIPISVPMRNFVINTGISAALPVVKESVDLSNFFPCASNILIDDWGVLRNETIIMFHGAIEKAKGIDTLLYAAKLLESQYKNLRFIIVGSGTDFPRAKLMLDTLELKNVTMTGWVAYEDVPKYINACDIGIALRANNLANNFVVTTALMQYYACNKPIIAPAFEAIQEICIEGKTGAVYDPGNASSLASAIERLLLKRDEWGKFGAAGRDLVLLNYKADVIGKELANALNRYMDTNP